MLADRRCAYCDNPITGRSPEDWVIMDRRPNFNLLLNPSKDPKDYLPRKYYVCRICFNIYQKDYNRKDDDIYDEMREADLNKKGWQDKMR